MHLLLMLCPNTKFLTPPAKQSAPRQTLLILRILILTLNLKNQKSSFTLATNCRGSPMEIAGDPNPLADV
jgi:hypothetical protein